MLTLVIVVAVLVLVIVAIGYMPLTVLGGGVSLGLIYVSQTPGSSATPEGVGAAVAVIMAIALLLDSSWRKKRVAHDRQQKLYRQAQKELELEAIKDQLRTHKA